MFKKNFIENKIKVYFNNVLKNDLMFFDFISNNEKKILSKYFEEEDFSLDENIQEIKNIFINKIKTLENEKIYYYIDLIKKKNIFVYSKKNNYKFDLILNQKKILKPFFTNFMINIILDIYINCKQSIKMFEKYFNYKEKINICGLEKNIIYLNQYINLYYNFFINFYIYLLNKKDKNIKYIFPFYQFKDSQFLLSVVNMETEKGGDGAEENVDFKKIQNILIDMENNNNNIKNYYTKSEIQKLENILENKKINKLIYNNEIKLSKNYKTLINSVIESQNVDNPDKYDKYTKSKEFFNNLFVIDKEENKNQMDSLYEIYINEPDKKKFIDYISDKIYYNNYLKKPDIINSDTEYLKQTTNMLAVFDKVFSQILNTDLNNNMLHLSSDDVKFILMLEVLNTLKQNVKQDASIEKNITLNIFKEIKGVSVNDESIKVN